MSIDIYQYTDYRQWLKESLEDLKKEKFFASFRYVGSKTGIDPGNLVRILQSKAHLSKKASVSMGTFLKLDKKQMAYLDEMIVLAKAKTDSETWKSYNRLHELKSVEVRSLEDHEFEFFSEWYHTSVRSMLDMVDVKNNYQALGKMLIPPITSEQVKESMDLLKKLNFIKKDENGCWRSTDNFIKPGKTGQDLHKTRIRNYQRNHLDLAQLALTDIEPELRDISTLSITLPQESLADFKETLKDFRNKIMGMAESLENEDSVYQLNLSFFPSAISNKGKEK